MGNGLLGQGNLSGGPVAEAKLLIFSEIALKIRIFRQSMYV